MKIHSTSVISKEANLDSNVEVGPYSIIGAKVNVGAGTKIGSFCVLEGPTTIGKNCKIFTGAIIGSAPQDLKYKDEETTLIIGDNNTIREYATLNRGTHESGKTVVGNNNLLMAYAHIAHDCVVGSDCILANNATLAGSVTLEDRVVVGGLTAIHQFCRIGTLSITGGCSKVTQDIPPYATSDGHPAKIFGLNLIGLKRANIKEEAIKDLRKAYRIIFQSGLLISSAVEKIQKELPNHAEIKHLVEFIKNSKRGISK
ncbi:MAG: acyl-ACP--UDP-N-acetylglucosamine O-acyltransferase [Candidatus Omnitrophota bacterium]